MEELPPLFLEPVQAGFPSPASDYIEESLDLNKLMVPHPAATFFVRVQGDSMKDASITTGDILVVDRSVRPTHNKIIVAILDGEFTVKRLHIEKSHVSLRPENPKFPPILINKDSDFQVFGVVTYVIHKTK